MTGFPASKKARALAKALNTAGHFCPVLLLVSALCSLSFTWQVFPSVGARIWFKFRIPLITYFESIFWNSVFSRHLALCQCCLKLASKFKSYPGKRSRMRDGQCDHISFVFSRNQSKNNWNTKMNDNWRECNTSLPKVAHTTIPYECIFRQRKTQ